MYFGLQHTETLLGRFNFLKINVSIILTFAFFIFYSRYLS